MLYPIELWAQDFCFQGLRLDFVRGEFLRSAHSLPKCTATARKTYHVPGRTAKIRHDHVERLGSEKVRGKVGVVLGRGCA